jgi:histone H3/H4
MIEVGNGTSTPTVFQCSQQNQPGAVDAIVRDLSLPSTYQTVSSLETKLIVNATEKSFAETREKVQKIAEEESRKTVKDVVM